MQLPTWQASVDGHTGPPTHLPCMHVSFCVQPFLSTHEVPSIASGLVQPFMAGSQTPAVWHMSSATHCTGLPAMQVPSMHVSFWVQTLPSSQALPESGEHTPSTGAPAALEHASHAPPLHAVLQQTPSTQLPLRHCAEVPHAVPSVSGEPHFPPMQRLPELQSVSSAHIELQAPPAHP